MCSRGCSFKGYVSAGLGEASKDGKSENGSDLILGTERMVALSLRRKSMLTWWWW